MSVSWVPDFEYVCPDLSRLFYTTKRTRELFNNCFIIENIGPDAPNLDFESMDNVFTIYLDSDFDGSNNMNLSYKERGAFFPEGVDDPYYHFEGYLVFQLRDENIKPSLENLYDPDLARLVFQSDIENDVGDIYNWNPIRNPNPLGRQIFRPHLKVEAGNAGLESSFILFEDAFAEGDEREFVPGREYYFAAIAYAHNNYKDFNWREPEIGQRFPFLASTRNIKVYSFTMSDAIGNNGDDPPLEILNEELQSSPNEHQLNLYILKNPGGDQLNFIVDGPGFSLYDVEVFGSTGLVFYSGKAKTGFNSIDAAQWHPGIYILSLFDPENNQRLVKLWIKHR